MVSNDVAPKVLPLAMEVLNYEKKNTFKTLSPVASHSACKTYVFPDIEMVAFFGVLVAAGRPSLESSESTAEGGSTEF